MSYTRQRGKPKSGQDRNYPKGDVSKHPKQNPFSGIKVQKKPKNPANKVNITKITKPKPINK